MGRRTRIALALILVCSAAGALVFARARKGWKIDPAEVALWHCQTNDDAECVRAARILRSADRNVEAVMPAGRGCDLSNAEACRVLGSLRCGKAPVRDLPASARAYVKGCRLGDVAACGELASLVREPSVRELIPRSGQFTGAWIASAVSAVGDQDADLARELLTAGRASPSVVAVVEFGIALNARDYAAANRQLTTLRDLEGDNSVENRVLENFLGAQQAGKGVWVAGIREWQRAGHPDMVHSELIGTRKIGSWWDACWPRSELDAENQPTVAALLVPGSQLKAPKQDEVVAAALKVDANSLLTERLAAYAVLGGDSEPAKQQRERLKASMSTRALTNLFFGLWVLAVTGTKGDALTTLQLAELERVAALPYQSPRAEVGEVVWARTPARLRGPRLLPTDLSLIVELVWSAPFYELGERTVKALEGQDKQARERFGRALTAAAEKLAHGGWLLELMVGSRLMVEGAKLSGSADDLARAEALLARGKRLAKPGGPIPEFGVWPVGAIAAEIYSASLTDEVAYLEEVARAGGR